MSATSATVVMDERKPTVEIKPRTGWFDFDFQGLWQYRELLYFLTWKDVIIRYKQTVIGAAWAILQPLLTMVIFTMVFRKFAGVSSDGLPYPIFAFTALLPWQFFSQAVSRSSTSLVTNREMISKVYFPRLIMPISSTLSPAIDFCIAFVILIGMMAWYGLAPTWGILALPIFLLLALQTALAVCFFLSALNVKYRDVGHTIPFLVQCWMYASPVAYSVNLVPESWRFWYSLNPMVGVIEGFRWALLSKASPDFGAMITSAVAVTVLFVTGLIFFRRMERTFADVI
ncbi:ABC transporter permease [Candidatus Entotheonella palauensis]|uniref:ABC transporter permease n=1 Tax=Candidatus Entotheonella palauensis TaxID=93172 RepID=UPI00211881C9|nr:ABC transporter permease [Candidatus Entotheonella palauensis]